MPGWGVSMQSVSERGCLYIGPAARAMDPLGDEARQARDQFGQRLLARTLPSQVKPYEGKSSEVKSSQIKSSQAKPNQATKSRPKPRQVKSSQVTSSHVQVSLSRVMCLVPRTLPGLMGQWRVASGEW